MKTLILSAAFATAMATSAVALPNNGINLGAINVAAASIATAGAELIGTPVLNTEGEQVGVVAGIESNDVLKIDMDGEMKMLNRTEFDLQESEDDSDARGYKIILNAM
jgi:hypothetical protein